MELTCGSIDEVFSLIFRDGPGMVSTNTISV